MSETFYELLGVAEDATTDEIESAYRERLKQTHPDVSADERAGEKTKRIIRAKEVLTDAGERERYDRLGHQRYLDREGDPGDGTERWRAREGATATGAETAEHPGESGPGGRYRNRHPGPDGSEARHEHVGGPGWSDTGGTYSTGAAASTGGPSTTAGQHVGAGADGTAGVRDSSWESTQGYTISGQSTRVSQPHRLFPTRESLLLIAIVTAFYPVLVFSSVHPFFPLVVNVVVGLCTLLTVGYLLSLPEVALTVFGFWSMVTPLALVALPGIGLLSVVGALALMATWIPLGLSVLVLSVMRP